VRLGLHALGIGAGADRAVIDAVASAADDCGFATLWVGEHVVMVDRSASRYPYSEDGVIAVPAQADWLDPMITLSFIAAASSRIGIATGVLLLPEHNAVVVAKQAASLDRLSAGRLTLGVGVGWSREEFEALGVPFEHRAARTAEYVAAMRTLWRDDVASFNGRFVGFDSIRVNPKPMRDRRIPVVLDGVAAVRERIDTLEQLCAESGRDRAELRLSVALVSAQVGEVGALAELGVDELVLVEAPPEDPDAATDWVSTLADRWMSEL
jgi:alkanesulfonate monooxygenase SsuD/methylene tetrahydromethanopterin reductase-like flavin-dependent oxidoreductase (luciferase family)